VNAIACDWRSAPLSVIDHALCAFAEKITQHPAAMSDGDIQSLREIGLSDRAIHDAVQVICYFNYINRVAETLGVENENFVRAWGELDLD
jgi:uncharacterized peroxidase-related enzyme